MREASLNDTGQTQNDFLTFERSREDANFRALISFVAASRARISRRPDEKPDSPARDRGSGASLPASSVNFSPGSSSSRTPGTGGARGCLSCGAISDNSGTPACLYECEPLTLGPLTSDHDASLLPTLTASSYGYNAGGAKSGRKRLSLQSLARNGLLPTLTIRGNYNRAGATSKSGDGLATVLGGLMNPTWLEWFMGFPLEWTESAS